MGIGFDHNSSSFPHMSTINLLYST